MEQYEIESENQMPISVDGKYFGRIHDKHINSYGKEGSENIAENVIKIFQNTQKQVSENTNHNSLLVGKVQSGKTSNLELFSALAFDNGYNFLVIYGGYDSKLLGQTTKRFKKTFDAEDSVTYESDSPAIFSTEEKDAIPNLTSDIINEFLDMNKPVILISMKRPPAMRIVNDFIATLDTDKLKPFVIDDEGDQASLNTKRDKKNEASATYAEITRIKKILNNPLYLSVTATPQANIFLDKWSELRPASIWLISPAKGYNGALQYHLSDGESIQIIDDDEDDFSDNAISNSLREAINYFIVASAIKRNIENKNKVYSDMIIHTAKERSEHKRIFGQIDSYIEQLQFSYKNADENLKDYVLTFEEILKKYFSSENYTYDNIKANIEKIIKSIKLILQNSEGKETQANPQLFPQKIFIGGDLLQRGLTFDNLITTYFTRWAKKSGNMDTTLQRARWFGYRSKYFDLCKIFTSSIIAQEFTNLAEIDEDLWEQFADIEANKMRIEDIIISGENTALRPTSPNKVKFQKIKFKRRWVVQRFIVEDRSIIHENASTINKLIDSAHWYETTKGSQSNQVTGYFTNLKANHMQDIIKTVKNVFEYEPFQKDALLKLLDTDEVVLIQMGDIKQPRFRSLYKNEPRIKPLQQGASSLNKEKASFLGDRFIVIDESKINIQLYNVAPGKSKEDIDKSLIQYMFAVYVPKEKVYFTRGEANDFVE